MRYCTATFMRDIIYGKKKKFLKSEVSEVKLRGYNELSVQNLIRKVLPNPKIEEYMPDKTGKQYKID